MRKLILFTALTFSMTACVTYPIPRYAVSVQNVSTMKKSLPASSYSVKLVEEAASNGKTSELRSTHHPNEKKSKETPPNQRICRAMKIHIPDGRSFKRYTVDALKDELQLAEKYDSESKNKVKIRFEKIDFSSHTSTWEIKSTVNYKEEEKIIELTKKFEASFAADNACRDIAVNFQTVVEIYISKVVDFLSGSNRK